MISLDIQTSYSLGQAGGDFSWTMDASTTALSTKDKNKSEQQRQQTTNISEDKSGDLSGDWGPDLSLKEMTLVQTTIA